MAFSLPTVIPHGSKSGNRDTSVHAGFHELYNHYDPRDRGGNNNNNLRVSLKQVEWGQYNPYLRYIRWSRRFRFGIYNNNSWFRFLIRGGNQSRKSSTGNTGNRKNYRNHCYYYLIIGLLAIGTPAYAEPEVQNTSNPVAAATGNVTNQAVQFQNNGAPSRQVYGANNSCNGATMTFSPFYMGNHTTPYDDHMDQQSYTVAENWGAQLNFMMPLDGSLVEICKSIAKKHSAKMSLDYELVRLKECASLQQKGFMIRPGTRVYHICSDVIPIAAFKAEVLKAQKAALPPPPPKKWWQNLNPFKK